MKLATTSETTQQASQAAQKAVPNPNRNTTMKRKKEKK
jgi:hypothetical protein